MKGHYIARTLTFCLGVGLIGYVVWLWLQKTHLVVAEDVLVNTIAYIFILLLGVVFITLVVVPTMVPNNRRGIAVVGVGIIILAHLYLLDDATKHVYMQDVLKVVGVALIITGPMKLLLTPQAQQKKYMEEVEIIEV